MKRPVLFVFLLCATTAAFAQAPMDADTLRYRNELGIDATPFIKNILQFSEFGGSSYATIYSITYRRYIKRGALRVGLGGGFSRNESESFQTFTGTAGDTSVDDFRAHQVDARIGYEFYTNLARRWQIYYGADARLSTAENRAVSRFVDGTTETERTQTSSYTYYGVAPVLGVRFRLTPRISLRTEASFSILRSTSESESRVRTTDPSAPPLADQVSLRKSEGFVTSFQQPLALFINFDL